MGGCAYLAIASREPVARPIYDGLRRLQHRGQETAGILTFDGTDIYNRGGAGLVHDVFGSGGIDTRRRLSPLKGNWGLGSTRYRTSGSDKSAPPFYIHNPCFIAGAFNGNIINCHELWRQLNVAGQYRGTSCDFEVLLKTLGHELSKVMRPTEPLRNTHIYTAAANTMDRVDGSYSAVFLVAKSKRQRLVGIRDPSANRPMAIGKAKEPGKGWVIASEDCLFRDLGYETVCYPKGGEVNIIDWNLGNEKKNLTVDVIEDTKRPAGRRLVRPLVNNRGGEGHCMFEWTYFARPDSYIDGRSVFKVRKRLGYKLGKREQQKIDIAIPSPDSGRSAVSGYVEGYNENIFAKLLGKTMDEAALKELEESLITYEDGIYKSPYAIRNFQLPDKIERDANIDIKHTPNSEVLSGMRVTIKDDSTVRLTTLYRLVRRMYDAGAKEVHVRITTPLIYSFCMLGIDMRTKKELVARRGFKTISEFMDLSQLPGDVMDRIIMANSLEQAAEEMGTDPDLLRARLEDADRRVVEVINSELEADSLSYCTIDELVDAINEVPVVNGGPESIPYEKLCTGCLGGRYPLERPLLERVLKSDRGNGRAWEQRAPAKKAA